MTDNKKPIVYSCSGCSNLALIAHDLALNMDRDGIAEMSCISGVIGKVPQIVQIATSGRPIIAIDGCSMGCTKSCLDACKIKADHYFDLSQFGIEKHDKWQSALTENNIAMMSVYQELEKFGFIQESLTKK